MKLEVTTVADMRMAPLAALLVASCDSPKEEPSELLTRRAPTNSVSRTASNQVEPRDGARLESGDPTHQVLIDEGWLHVGVLAQASPACPAMRMRDARVSW